ncbi:OprO/OprP family phosphate-selective porin [Methylophaga sp. OBS4]|uniref:OprO/OprP family phosphate-selective porin n=1 Tax=Methylophaga sp. OBS4 TaxID=2991935 RepID=UPI00225A42B1|nr:porin [Methylophaga sp. OBS4]MCX4186357.1 OprO/OprP family phosphate-selective porin [Methylophaga sp. OBS4]
MKLKTTSLLIAGTLFGAAMLPAQANNDAMIDLLKVLRDKGTISAQDYDLLANAAKADKEATEAAQAEVKAEVKEATADMPKITTKGKLVVEDREGNWSFQPIGRVMWDAVTADADTGSESDDAEGTELRRARLGFEGAIYSMGYKFEADFAGGDASIKDAYISYGNKLTDNTKYGVKLGQSHIPFGLNTKISSKYMSFMDRPLFADSSISPARESGAVVSVNDKDYKWLLAAGLTNGGLSDGETDNNGSTFAVRGSFVPYMQDSTHLLQIGAGYLTKGGGDSFKFDQRLVSHIDNSKPLSTGTVAASEFDGSDAFTVDAMGVFGSFHTMAEYIDYSIERETADDIDIDGYAVEAGYFLTGESLKWKKGYTSGISPKSKYGAWQIAARFENLEIQDSQAGDDEADKFTIGVNYYPTQNTRLMLNYDKVTDLTVNGAGTSIEPSALKFRAQAYW